MAGKPGRSGRKPKGTVVPQHQAVWVPPESSADEVVQLTLLRSCWLRAEQIFHMHMRTICLDWTGGDRERANKVRRQILSHALRIPAELEFAVTPLVNAIEGLEQSRRMVDAALDQIIPDTGVLRDIPEGYIRPQEAARILGVHIGHFRHDSIIRKIASARSVLVALPNTNKREGKRYYPLRCYALEDVEAAKALLDENPQSASKRFEKAVVELGKQPFDAIPLSEVAARIGMDICRIKSAIRGGGSSSIPRMYKFHNRWFSFEEDIETFLERRSRFENTKDQPDTAAAAKSLGLSQSTFLQWCKRLEIEPVRFGHHARYSPDDLSKIRSAWENQRILAAEADYQTRREREQRRAELEQQRAEEQAQIKLHIRLRDIPPGGIPASQMLSRIGMKRKRFEKIRAGRSGTPIPRVHKAPNGRLYCLPEDLEAFCSGKHRQR